MSNISHPIMIKFDEINQKIDYKILAIGETSKVVASNKQLRLIHGRLYAIPVSNIDINTDFDKYTVKIPSDLAAKIDVRYIKDGFAYILPLENNIILKDGYKIANVIEIQENIIVKEVLEPKKVKK